MDKKFGALLFGWFWVGLFLGFCSPVAAAESQTFPQTGFTVSDEHGFLTYWRKNGGLAVYGYPVSPERPEVNPEDGKTYRVQWFERNRFEWHPENKGTKYEIQLGLLGKQLTRGRENETPFKAVAPVANSANLTYFAATGHTLSKGFKTYWEKNGALERFGYPITEEFAERNPEDGKTYLGQWFERARFEYHPENAAPNDVLLGLLGKQALADQASNPNPNPVSPPANILPRVDLPLPAEAKGLPLTQAEFDDLQKKLSVQGWQDLKFGYFTVKGSVKDTRSFYRSALPANGFTIMVDADINGAVGISCHKGQLIGVMIIDQVRPETLNVVPFKGKNVTVGDTFIFIYHGIGQA